MERIVITILLKTDKNDVLYKIHTGHLTDEDENDIASDESIRYKTYDIDAEDTPSGMVNSLEDFEKMLKYNPSFEDFETEVNSFGFNIYEVKY